MNNFKKEKKFLHGKGIVRRLLSLMLALVMTLAMAPSMTLETVWAASITAKPWFTDPDAGSASPASADGTISAVPYIYSETALLGQSNSWFLYTGTDEVQFEAVFEEISGVSDYGTVTFNAKTAPYITYTPSTEVANQTVIFKVKASAGSESATGDFVWTVKVGAVPDTSASDNAELSALTYTVGDGTPVPITLEDGVSDYKVTLTDADYNKKVTLSGTAADAGASVSGGELTAGYWPEKTNLTVTAADHWTAKTYSVEFSIPQKDTASAIYVGSQQCWDGETVLLDTVYVTPDQKYSLGLDCGGGTKGYGFYSVITDVGKIGNQYGPNNYPNSQAALGFTLQKGERFTATVNFYREHVDYVQSLDLTPAKTIEITIIAGEPEPEADVAEVVTGSGDRTVYKSGGLVTAADALREAWNAAVAGSTDASPATLTLLKSVDISDNEKNVLAMSAGNVILQMSEGVTLTGNVKGSESGVINVAGGTLTMKSGTIENSYSYSTASHASYYGVGVYIRGTGIFNMTGGEVKATGQANATGIKISNSPDAVANISGGKVSGTYSGVEVDYTGEVNISGSAEVCCKDSAGFGVYFSGGPVYYEGAILNVSGGTITGIYLYDTSATITGGKISGVDVATSHASADITNAEITGPVSVSGGTADLSNCNIFATAQPNYYYGVCAMSSGTANIHEGVHIKVTNSNSYGVYVSWGGTVNIEDGVTVEAVDSAFHGVHITGSGSKANISGGDFRANRYGLYAEDGGTAVLSGGTFTGGNFYGAVSNKNGTAGDLLAENYAYFEGTEISDAKRILNTGVGSLNSNMGYGTVTVGKALVTITEQPKNYMLQVGYTERPTLSVKAEKPNDVTADLTYQWYQKNDNGKDEMIAGAAGSSYQIPANLAAKDYKYYCVVTCDGYSVTSDTAVVSVGKQTGTVTITKAPGKIYDGSPVSAESIKYTPTSTGAVKIEYKSRDAADDTYTAAAPKNAGDYTVRVTVAADDTYEEASAAEDFTISRKELTVTVAVKDKKYDGLNRAEIEGDTKLNGVVSGDIVNVTNGIPSFTSVEKANDIPIQFTEFALSGADAGNYVLIQPTGVTASITAYTAVKGTDYTVNSNDWQSGAFVVTAGEGCSVSTTNAVEGDWKSSLSAADETPDGRLTFYVKTADGAISEVVTETYKIDKTAPTIAAAGNNVQILQKDTVSLTVTAGDSGIAKVEVKKDDGDYTDITDSYTAGYPVTENGVYTFRVTNGAGTTAESGITYTMLDSAKPAVNINSGDYVSDTWTNGSVVLSVTNTANNLGTTAFSYKIGRNGAWRNYTGNIDITDDCNSEYIFRAVSESGITSDEVSIIVKRDTESPTGEVAIGENTWRSFLNKISFGLFFKEHKEVEVKAEDAASGIDSIQYYISETAVSEDDIETVTWTEYGKKFFIEPNHKYVVYAKITDKAGNETVLSSDGVVLYTDAAADMEEITFVKTSGKDVTVPVTLNGSTIASIKNGSDVLTEGTDYTVSQEGVITFKAAYLDNFAASDESYILTVSYDPLGISYVDQQGNDAPAATEIELKVVKEAGSISIMSPMDKQYDGQAVLEPQYKVTGDGQITIEYAEKGSDLYTSEAPVNAGIYVVRAVMTATANYSGAVTTMEFTIGKANPSVSMEDASAAYTGSKAVYDGPVTVTLVNGETYDGEVSYSYRLAGSSDAFTGGLPVNAGTYEIKASTEALDNYNAASSTAVLTIHPTNIANAEVVLGDALTANGEMQTQSIKRVTVINDRGEVMDVTYTVTGNQGKEPGTYIMTITGRGNYSGTVTRSFVIAENLSAPDPGNTGNPSGNKPGSTGSNPGNKPGSTGSNSGNKPGSTGSNSGNKPGSTGSNPGNKPGSTGSKSANTGNGVNVKTGDSNNLIGWLALLAVSGGVIACAAYGRRRKRNTELNR